MSMSFHKIVSLLLMLFCINCESVNSKVQAIEPSVSKLATAEPCLVEANKENATSELVADVGIIDQLDDFDSPGELSAKSKNHDMSWVDDYIQVLDGFKHAFYLKNPTDKEIIIAASKSSDTNPEWCHLAMRAIFVANAKQVQLPYTVKPGATLGVEVALNPVMANTGQNVGVIELLGLDQKTPVATLIMKGTIQGGITIKEPVINFGRVTGDNSFVSFTIHFDRRAPGVGFGPLQLVSTSKYVTLKCEDAGKEIMGMPILKDGIDLKGGDNAPRDFELRCRAELSDKAPIGAFTGIIKLIAPNSPFSMIVRGVEVPFKGEVVKREK